MKKTILMFGGALLFLALFILPDMLLIILLGLMTGIILAGGFGIFAMWIIKRYKL